MAINVLVNGAIRLSYYKFRTPGSCDGLSIVQYTVLFFRAFKGKLSDSFTNYNYVGNTKVSVSIKKTSANKCTLSDIFLTEI